LRRRESGCKPLKEESRTKSAPNGKRGGSERLIATVSIVLAAKIQPAAIYQLKGILNPKSSNFIA
jgi:hypothetical protein